MTVDTVEKEIKEDSTISVAFSSLECEFETENYQGELDFPALGVYDIPEESMDALASKATKTTKTKFRYPARDPEESDITDDRNDQEILEDILRISSQILTPQELTIWNEIAGQDLTDTMKFNNDVRIPKTVLDAELRRHKKLKDPKDILETVNDFEPNIGIEVNSADAEESTKKTKTLMQLNTETLTDETVIHLQDNCKFKLQNYIKSLVHRPRNYVILKTCPNLFANLLQVLIYRDVQDKKSKRIMKIYNKLVRVGKSPNKKVCKKLLLILLRHNVLTEEIFMKPRVNVFCKFANSGPTVDIQCANKTMPWLLDTGSSYSLIPHSAWKELGINDNKLNCSTTYSINSVSHANEDAVIGSIVLELSFPALNKDYFTVNQKCLVLRPRLALNKPLLGSDFMSRYNVCIKFFQNIPRVTILDEEVPLKETFGESMTAQIKVERQLKVDTTDVMDPTHVWSNFSEIPADQFPQLYTPIENAESELDIKEIHEFIEQNKQCKINFNQEINAYSVVPESYDDILKREVAGRSILPDVGCSNPQTRLTHLSPEIQQKMTHLIEDYADIFSRHKHHLGTFKGWKVKAEVDPSINCRQAPRNRVLPSSCKQDLYKYKDAGLFSDSTGLADKYCANITLVLRNQIKEIKKSTKADKYIQRKSPNKVSVEETRPLEPEKKDSQSSRNLYRMTIDFRDLNRATLNEKTCQLPSIQSIESSFHDSYVSTLDLSNCYPSILIDENSRNYFNFYMENEIWNHSRVAQGWCGSLTACQKAVSWTFRDEVLQKFVISKALTTEQFPFDSFRLFLKGFVDDLAVHSAKSHKNAEELHILCIEAVFYAVRAGGWLLKLEVSTFMNPRFVFLGLQWDMDEAASTVQNDRVKAILDHRVPRSMPELASRLATINYFSSFIPLMKRIAMPLYYIVRTGKFIWTRVHLQAYKNLLYLMAIQVRNYIFDPTKPLMLMSDMAALEVSGAVFQWCPKTLSLKLLQTKSLLLTAALRRQAPVHKEAYGTDMVLKMGKPYLFQTQALANFLFSDASSISYIARTKPFSSFLQQLSEEVSRYPTLNTIHMPGRALWYCDLFSRQLDNVTVSRPDTDISKEQSAIIPALRNVKPGAVLTNAELLTLFRTKLGPELFDVSTSDYEYIQRVDFSLYTNPYQFFTSEREFILGGLLGKLDPELALQLPTLQDIFKVKESASLTPKLKG